MDGFLIGRFQVALDLVGGLSLADLFKEEDGQRGSNGNQLSISTRGSQLHSGAGGRKDAAVNDPYWNWFQEHHDFKIERKIVPIKR